VARKPVFELIRERLGYRLGVFTLISSTLLNIITCAAEVGGVAIALQFLVGVSNISMIILTLIAIGAIIWFISFDWIERIFGLFGLTLLIFTFAVFKLHPNWHAATAGLVPSLHSGGIGASLITYLYFAVGIISSTIMPYEVYFYSSGGMEEGWKKEDIMVNKMVSVVGFSLGALLSISLLMIGAQFFKPLHITPLVHTTALQAVSSVYGQIGLYIALLAFIFVIGGSAIETCLSGAYNISQFYGWKWGVNNKKRKEVKHFTLSWIVMLIASFFVLLSGIDPVLLVEYSVIFSIIVLPLTYLPIMLVAQDKKIMKEYASGLVGKISGWIYFIIVCILAIAAIPLMILSNSGQS
jgi:Mn2+/Fe2+ NRAMP family transporter